MRKKDVLEVAPEVKPERKEAWEMKAPDGFFKDRVKIIEPDPIRIEHLMRPNTEKVLVEMLDDERIDTDVRLEYYKKLVEEMAKPKAIISTKETRGIGGRHG